MSKKLVYLLASGTLVGLLQWAVPTAYTSIFCEEECVQTSPAACPIAIEQNSVGT